MPQSQSRTAASAEGWTNQPSVIPTPVPRGSRMSPHSRAPACAPHRRHPRGTTRVAMRCRQGPRVRLSRWPPTDRHSPAPGENPPPPQPGRQMQAQAPRSRRAHPADRAPRLRFAAACSCARDRTSSATCHRRQTPVRGGCLRPPRTPCRRARELPRAATASRRRRRGLPTRACSPPPAPRRHPATARAAQRPRSPDRPADRRRARCRLA